VTIPAAIHTQRLALLRLLAGWEVVLGMLSHPVFADRVTWPVRAFLSSLLFRAELAAGYLVVAAARALVLRGDVQTDGFDALTQADAMAASLCGAAEGNGDAVPVARLRARVASLKHVLSNLPRAALRLLAVFVRTGGAGESGPCRYPLRRDIGAGRSVLRRVIRIDRPPDKDRRSLDTACGSAST